MNFIDENEIRKTIALMKPNGQLFEVRIPKKGKGSISGYFKDADTLIRELKKQNLKGLNLYLSLNEIKEACYSRMQRDKFLSDSEKTTSDIDINGYQWLMIDLDPKRPSGTSSSDAELQKAKDLGNEIYLYLDRMGFEKPLTAISGNGVHLLYKISMEASKASQDIIALALKTISLFFTNDDVDVDTSNSNPSRTCKLYGTLAQKGLNVEERPHRMSYIVGNPKEIKVTDVQYLKKLCNEFPKEPEKPQRYNNYNPNEFDLDEWLNKYGLKYELSDWHGEAKYKLAECPFNCNHTDGKASVFKFRNGAIAFKCFSASCSEYTWRDVRIRYEPDAYEKQYKQTEKQMFQTYNRNKPEIKHIEQREGEPVFFTAKDIVGRPKRVEHIIKTGIDLYDKRFRGFRKKDVTILSGYTGGAKSTLLSQLILNAIQNGNNVACFSGELAEEDYFHWLFLQAAGKQHIAPSQNEGYYNVPIKYQREIAEWLDNRFWLYNNKYGFNFGAIIEQLEKMIDDHKLDMLCIDNLMAMDISELSREKYEAQSAFAWRLHKLAQEKDVHIIVVCHPRKPTGLLNRYDISGTSDIANAVDNIVFIYRIDQSFSNFYKQFFQFEYKAGGTNVWHCDKSRFGSVDDSYNPLYYEKETKRLKNSESENITYGWVEKKPETENDFTETDDDNPFV